MTYQNNDLKAVLLTICFTELMLHGLLLGVNMLSVISRPVIEDKAGSVLSRSVLHQLGVYLDTTDNQFGFKVNNWFY